MTFTQYSARRIRLYRHGGEPSPRENMVRPRLLVCLPFQASSDPMAWGGPAALATWSNAVEDLGFDGIAVTDHPFPAISWLNGGHHALDPFIALTAMAATTQRVRLVTDVLVAGYRNPYLLAKAVASLDVVSAGRLCIGIGAGYQREEFSALGAQFDGRGRVFDATLDATYAALTGQPVVDSDGPFPAAGTHLRPLPIQQPRPPFWIGGNSDAAMRRAVTKADGWMPFPQPRARVATSLSPPLGSLDALAERIAQARAWRSVEGRAPLEFCSGMFGRVEDAELPSALEDYGRAGVTWVRILAPGMSMRESILRLEQMATFLA